jgi:hypothetical protein
MKFIALVALLTLLSISITAQAANTPCSGKKGGISHCDGALFVCNDGSISGSKKNCAALYGQPQKTPKVSADECACGTGRICIGPRGGRYCTTPSGNKSYLRR